MNIYLSLLLCAFLSLSSYGASKEDEDGARAPQAPVQATAASAPQRDGLVKSMFGKLPEEVVTIILNFLPPKDQKSFADTCWYFRDLTARLNPIFPDLRRRAERNPLSLDTPTFQHVVGKRVYPHISGLLEPKTSLFIGALLTPTEITSGLNPFLRSMPRLTSLSLNGNNLGPAGAAVLVPALKALTGLKELRLGNNGLGPEGAAAIGTALKALPGLSSLSLGLNNLGPAGAKALAPALQALTGLTELNLGLNGLGPEGAAAIGPALQALTGLSSLDLGGNNLGHEGVKALLGASEALPVLTSVDPGNNLGASKDLGPEGADALAPALQQMTGLRTLNLGVNNLGPLGAAALAPVLPQMTSLTSLNLRGNNLGRVGAKALAPALQQMTGLRTLNLEMNSIPPEEIAAIRALLPQTEIICGYL